MNIGLSTYLKKFEISLYFILSFIISWSVWIPQALNKLGIIKTTISLDSPLNIITAWGPGIAAILITLLTKRKGSIQGLFRPIGKWHVKIYWYVIVISFPAIVNLISFVIDRILGQNYQIKSIIAELGPEYQNILPLLIISALPNALGEEIGWRGFVLPKLQVKYNALVSSLIVGIFWSIWHIPTWIAQGIMGLSILSSIIFILAVAILFTWVYNSTNGSLLLVWLFHTSFTVTGYFLSLPTLTDDILLWIIVILIIAIAGSKDLSFKRKTENTN